ncbi:mucin-5AC-like [Patiria miniata]|uniref:Homologous recombination OB-fold protein OB-fold domain-containing protein n=1 Tax=Patiria miniata TaxID=46514 RepID=A0A913YYR8_PATMI|nr:mucin-5AC-like [Patiria miniata]
MFQIGEEDFSFGDDEDFWSEALEVEAATTASNSGKSVASSVTHGGSLAAENHNQQNQTRSSATEKALLPRSKGLSTQTPGQHLAGLRNAPNGLGAATTLQVSSKGLPTTPGNQAKRKFSFKQKSPRGNPTAPSVDAAVGANKRAKYDEQRPTPFNNTHKISNDKSGPLQDLSKIVQKQPSVTTGNLQPPANQISGAPKLRQPLINSSSSTVRKDQQSDNQGINQQFLQQRTNKTLLDKTRESQTQNGPVTGRDPTLHARANQNFRLPGQQPDIATSKPATEHPFEFGDNFDEEMDLSEDYFNWDPVIEPLSTTSAVLSEPKSAFIASNHSKPCQEKRASHSVQNICHISKPISMPSPPLGSTPGYSNPSLTMQSGTSNTQVNSNQLRPISTQGGSLRSVVPPNNSSSGAPQSAQLNNSLSSTRFNSPLATQNPRPNFPQTRTQQLQGNPPRMNFQPRTPSPSFPAPRPATQYPLRTNTPMRAGTPGYTSPSPRFQGRGVTQGVTSAPQTPNIRTPNTNISTPRQFATPAQCFQNSCTNRGSTTQGDRPFTTHGAKPQSRGTPTPQTPLLTSRVAQLFQTPTTSSSGPTRTRVRKFPGPAGVLPKLAQGQKLNDIKLPSPENDPDKPSTSSNKQGELDSSQDVGETDFSHGAWQTMKTDLGLDEGDPRSMLARNNIALVLRKASLKQLTKNKVPHLCVMIKAVAFDADASVVLRDPSGEMQGTVHRRVVEEHQSELKPGSVLVLRQVGVLSPSLRNHYLNITPSNLIQIYPSEAMGLSQSSQRTPKSRSRHPSTSKEGLSAETEQNTPKRSETSETKSRRHSGGVKNGTLVEASPDDTFCKLRRFSSGSRLVEEGKHAEVNHRASSSSDLRLDEETTLSNGNHSISSRLEAESTHFSVSHGINEPKSPFAKSCTVAAADTRSTTVRECNSMSSFSNVQKSEDFTELLADIGDDFFEDF